MTSSPAVTAPTRSTATGDDTLIGARASHDARRRRQRHERWNNGDASGHLDGGNDTDVLQVNSPTGDDEFDRAGTVPGVQFDRISLNGATAGNFRIDNTTIEQVQVNGLGGNDRATGSAGSPRCCPRAWPSTAATVTTS